MRDLPRSSQGKFRGHDRDVVLSFIASGSKNLIDAFVRCTGLRRGDECIGIRPQMEGSNSNVAPAFGAPPHLVDDSGALRAWFIEPAGALLQFARPVRGTTQMAEWLVGPAFDVLVQRFSGRRGLRVILDMREMTGRSASARAVLLANVLRVLPRIGHVVMLPSQHMGAEYMSVIELTVRIVNAMGLPLEVAHDLESVLADGAVRMAPARAANAQTSAAAR